MSIYDTAPKPPIASSEPVPPPPRRRWGCGSCVLGCFAVLLLAALLAALAGWYAWSKLPDWSRDVLVATIEGSDLPEEQKRQIVVQVDRVVAEYKAGRATWQEVRSIFQELSESPLFSLAMAYAASVKYIEPSGLSAEEKQQAQIALQRVARGVYEQLLTNEQLDSALDYVSTRQPNGERHFAETVTDENLRALVAECQRLADEAGVPPGPYEVDVAREVQRAVDKVLVSSKARAE